MKKGVGPLIATIIVIGISVVLGGVIMGWGSSIVKEMQKATEKSSQHSLACTEATFEIKSAYTYGTMLEAVIESTGKRVISNFVVRVTGAAGSDTVRTSGGISPFAIIPLTAKYDPGKVGGSVKVVYNVGRTGLAKKVEMFPMLKDEEGDEFDCLREVTRAADATFDESVTAAYVLDKGYVDLEEIPPLILDAKGIAPQGIVYGPNWIENGGYDKRGAFQFDGADDNITIPGNYFNFNNGFTITAWVFVESGANNQKIVDGGNFILELQTSGGPSPKALAKFIVKDTSSNSYTVASGAEYNIPLDYWIFLAAVYNANQVTNNITVYINKELQAKTYSPLPSPSNFNFNTDNIIIGAPKTSGTFFNGLIDEIIIYNKALAASEIEFPIQT